MLITERETDVDPQNSFLRCEHNITNRPMPKHLC